MQKTSFDEIYRQYSGRIKSYFRKRIELPEDCEELTADVFVNFHGMMERFDEERCSVGTYLYVIAANRLKNYYRDKKPTVPLEEMEDVLKMDGTPESAYLLQEQRNELLDSLEKLSERERKVLIYRFYQDKSVAQTAQILNLTVGNVRVIQLRALNKLREIMMQENQENK